MIVPFLFCSTGDISFALWLFYKYMDFALKNDYPVIANIDYFKNPSYYEAQNEQCFQNVIDGYNSNYGFLKPTDDMMKKLKKFPFTDAEYKQIMNVYPSLEIGCKKLLIEKNEKFEKIIIDKIESIEKQYGKIDAIITWTWFKSLENVCKKKKIKLLQLELTTFRPAIYQTMLGYFQFYDKYDSLKMDKDYLSFMNEVGNLKFFNRKELLALFLDKNQLRFLNHLNDSPKYELGISIGMLDYSETAKCHIDENKLLKQINQMVPLEKISLRMHPNRVRDKEKFGKYAIDKSNNALEWILKNKRIVSAGSNIAFETMLLGRTSYVMGDNYPYRWGGVTSLEQIEDKICEISYLNYIIFAYYAPYDLMFDKDYIEWRMTNPTLQEIYEYNQQYLLKNFHLDKNIFNISPKNRLVEIISKSKNISIEEANEILKNEPSLLEENEKLKASLQGIQSEYAKVINSKSWKVTKPLRWVTNHLGKNKLKKD